MTLTRVPKLDRYLTGKVPIPAGAIPLAATNGKNLVCLMADGSWYLLARGILASLSPNVQRDVLDLVVGQLGGTAATTAEVLGVSSRTVEGWRSCRRQLTPQSAYAIAQAIAAATAVECSK